MFLLIALLLLVIYLYSTRNHGYWGKRRVKHEPTVPIFGNHFRNVFGYKSMVQISVELYHKYPNEKIVGYYRGNTPELIIRDPDIVKQILSTDFEHFHLRGIKRNTELEPMQFNLFSVDGDTWKLLRQRLTPAFTLSKLKSMFPLVVRCAEKLQGVAGELAARGEEYDVRELMARFTTEFIGACGFGIDMDTINNEQSYFRRLGALMFQKDLKFVVGIGLMDLFPGLVKYIGLNKKEVDDCMIGLLTRIRDERSGNASGRHDFVDLLLELEQKGTIVGNSIEHPPDVVELELDIKLMAAQLFVFFSAGFETSSHSISFLLHQLAYNPEVQTRVQEDIDRVMAKYDNKLCDDAVAEMELLELAFKEAMRIFPSAGCLSRVCARKYTIPGTGVEITPGVKIIIPAQALQNDPAYWEQPDQFRPERFKEAQRHNYVYLPFGEGPRACIEAAVRASEEPCRAGWCARAARPAIVNRSEFIALECNVTTYNVMLQHKQSQSNRGTYKMFYILIALTAVLAIYLYTTRNHNYWAKRNVKHEPTVPIFGSHFRNLFGYKSIAEISAELYNKYTDEKIVGYYRGNTPELIIRDPDIVKHILSVDFEHFYRRGLGRNTDKEPMMLNLFHTDGDSWKLLRQRLTAAFTSSKLKNMFPLVVRCAEKLQGVAGELAMQGAEYDVRELMARITTEFIGACGFGIDMDTINNEKSYFRRLGALMFQKDLKFVIGLGTMELFPELMKYIGINKKEVDDCMINLLTKIRDERGGKASGRHDFVDLLLELEQKGKIVGNSIEHPPDVVELELCIKVMAAQLFVFFAAGFETSSHSTSFLLHQLAYNPEVQTRVQEDIDRVMTKYDNKLCYDAVAEMELLEMAFKEAMRIFPSLGCLNRVCTRKYTIPGTGVEITPGVKIIIPAQALQNDPAYWEQPDQFRPERFKEAPRHNYVYLPFGQGPRACIGARLGQMQSLAGLAAVLHRFQLRPGPSSSPRLQLNTFMNVVQGVRGGIPLLITERGPKTT